MCCRSLGRPTRYWDFTPANRIFSYLEDRHSNVTHWVTSPGASGKKLTCPNWNRSYEFMVTSLATLPLNYITYTANWTGMSMPNGMCTRIQSVLTRPYVRHIRVPCSCPCRSWTFFSYKNLLLDCEQSAFSLKIRRVCRWSERFGTENALSQKGTGARGEKTPSFLAPRASFPSDFEENKRLLAV